MMTGIVVPSPRRMLRKGGPSVFDYHVHTTYSVDCATPMEASCEAAVAARVTEIAFTDHLDLQPADMGYGFYKPTEYFAELERMRGQFEGRLTILAGVEVDYHTETHEAVEEFVGELGPRYDLVIGSVHYAAGGAIIFPEVFAGKHLDDVVLPYLDQVERAVKTGWFDTIGHLDIPKRYLPKTHRDYDPAAYRERIRTLLELFVERDQAFEINTSGMRQRPKSSMPGPAIMRWYAEAGGTRITTGTDSHAAQTVGAGLQTTLQMLKLCGIDEILSFRRRVETRVPIDTLLSA